MRGRTKTESERHSSRDLFNTEALILTRLNIPTLPFTPPACERERQLGARIQIDE